MVYSIEFLPFYLSSILTRRWGLGLSCASQLVLGIPSRPIKTTLSIRVKRRKSKMEDLG